MTQSLFCLSFFLPPSHALPFLLAPARFWIKVMQMLSYSYALALCCLLGAVTAQPQRGLPQPRGNSYDANAVILKQDFDLNPDGSYQYK